MSIIIEVVSPDGEIAQRWAENNGAVVKSCTFVYEVMRWHDDVWMPSARNDLGTLQSVYKLEIEPSEEAKQERRFEENAQYIPRRTELLFIAYDLDAEAFQKNFIFAVNSEPEAVPCLL